MTVRNEFLGGFQHNMRNDYVKGALKGKERLQGVVREHAPQRPLLPRPGSGRRTRDAQSAAVQTRRGGEGGLLEPECPGQRHGQVHLLRRQ